MKVMTGSQMAELDRKAIIDLQIDGLILMENAGIKIFQKIMKLIENWSENQETSFRNVVIISGKGNNGGDGFVIARHLIQAGIPTTIFATAERSSYSGDALKNYNALENFGDINIIDTDTLEDLRDSVLEASIVIDALLGTGISGSVEGIFSEIIDIINESDGVIVSVDIPSGVVADTGDVGNVAVEADYTETLAAPKLGLLLYPGAEYVGELNVNDISIPQELLENSESEIYLTTEKRVFDLLPWRPDDSNKGTYGKVLTIAGCNNMTGAGLLTSNSVLKIGAGLSTLASPKSLLPYYTGVYPEITYFPLEETSDKAIDVRAMNQLRDKIDDYDVVVLGPGIGVSYETVQFVREALELITEKELPLVVDADALNCMAQLSSIKLSENAVLTPHPREMSRLLAVKVEEIIDDKLKYVQLCREKYHCNVVLKGSRTIISYDNATYINSTGNSALATAGTGDVLCGIIAGLMAQGLYTFDAAVCGVYIHGLAGDLASEDLTEYSVVASDVMNYISKAMFKLSIL